MYFSIFFVAHKTVCQIISGEYFRTPLVLVSVSTCSLCPERSSRRKISVSLEGFVCFSDVTWSQYIANATIDAKQSP